MLNARHRLVYLFLAFILGHLVLISSHVNVNRGIRTLEVVTFGLFTEIQRVVSSLFVGVGYMWEGYVELRGLRIENNTLQQQVETLQVQIQEQRALVQRTQSLQDLLDLRKESALPTMSARVIAIDAIPWFRTITIDRGVDDGVNSDHAVIAATGVVGRVVGQPTARAARIQLLIDRNAAAGAMIERTRARGVVMGTDNDLLLGMEYVLNLEDVQMGDTVSTSGIDGIYPAGFVIGHIGFVEDGVGLYKTIRVVPSVDFAELEHVLIVMRSRSAGDLISTGTQ